MIEVNPSSWKTAPFPHQVVGVKFLLKNPVAALFDEMGSGKTFQFIVTANLLWQADEIDTVVIVAPSPVKTTWEDAEEGEIHLHTFVPSYVEEYTGLNTRLIGRGKYLHWIVTNYEFIRSGGRLAPLMQQLRGRKIMLVFDESSYIKSPKALQTKACKKLRAVAKRVYLSNGSPINNSLIDLYAPFAILDKSIIGCDNWWTFRNRYCVMGGYQNKNIVGYQHVEELQLKLKPFILRRLKEDCLNLPPKLYQLEDVAMEPETWRLYKQLRDETIAWLDTQTPIITTAAIVKIIRLSQLTSGIIGGLNRARQLAANMGLDLDAQQLDLESTEEEDLVDKLMTKDDIKVVSAEKHNHAVRWFKQRVVEQSNFRAIFWCRFRKEQEILAEKLIGYKVLRIHGGQKKADRDEVIRQFNKPSVEPCALLGQPRAGGIGTNLQAQCNWAVYISNDYSLLMRQQSEDRIHRSGQKASTVNYLDLLATGPQGQKTIDHKVRRALLTKDALALKTTAFWRYALLEE